MMKVPMKMELRWSCWLLLFALLIGPAAPTGVNLTIGYLPTILGEHRDKQGLSISGAITYALEQIEAKGILPKGVSLVLQFNDTRSDLLLTTKALTEMMCRDVVAVFGPENTCNVEATISSAWNRMMISHVSYLLTCITRYWTSIAKTRNNNPSLFVFLIWLFCRRCQWQKCADHTVSDKKKFPTFIRTYPTETQVSEDNLKIPFISLIRITSFNNHDWIYNRVNYRLKSLADELPSAAFSYTSSIPCVWNSWHCLPVPISICQTAQCWLQKSWQRL